jgi:Ran GTPase-activating protein 1
MFVSRLRAELPDSLKFLIKSLEGKKIDHLDMSDNAFGPDGIKAWDFFVSGCSDDLKVLKINNCGISPLGGEMISSALKAN